MPRIDDYKQALELAKKELSEKNPDRVAKLSGGEIQRGEQGGASLSLHYLNREIVIEWPGLTFSHRNANEEIPIQQQILILHYLLGVLNTQGAGVTGEWIAFQDIPDGKFYLDAFHRRAKNPMVQAFGERPDLLSKLAEEVFSALPSGQGDVGVVVKALPLVPLNLIIWKGDDEFPPEGNILFDRNVLGLLSAEDVAWLSGMVVYPLMGMANKRG